MPVWYGYAYSQSYFASTKKEVMTVGSTMFVLIYVTLRAKFIDVCKIESSENEIRLH